MSNKICPNCDHANPPNSKFCSNCGRRLPPSTEIICPNCQTPNPHNLFYCDHCGARLLKETLPTEVESDPGLEEPEQSSVHPADLFSLPTRKPGDTGKLDRNTLPDWLRTGGQEEDEDEADDEMFPEQPEAEETPSHRKTTDDLPDWLVTDSSVELYQPPSEITTEAFLQMTGNEPPELTDATGITDDLNLPDWLTDAVKDTDALTEKKQTKPQPGDAQELPNPFETSTNIPEWLMEVGGLTKDTEPTPDEEEDEEIPTIEEWGFSQSAHDDSLDWLMDSAAETAEPKVEHEAAIDLSDLRGWGTAVAPSTNLPDWYNELARPNSEKLNNWLLELDDVEEPEFVIDEPEGGSVADRLAGWLSESDEPATLDADDRKVTGMLTGWLSELDEGDESDYQEDDEESEEKIATGMLTGWLEELDDEEGPDFLGEEAETGQFTGWLAGDDEPDEPDFLGEEAETGQFTGWLAGDDEPDEPDFLDEAVAGEEADLGEFTNWLSASDEAEDSDLLAEAPEIDRFTDWLAGEDEVDELDLVEDEAAPEEKAVTGMLTGWLAELDEEDESDFLADEVVREVLEPTIVADWPADSDELEWADEEMEDEETAESAAETLPDWFDDFEQASTEPTSSYDEADDIDLDWMRSATGELFEEDVFEETADEPDLVGDIEIDWQTDSDTLAEDHDWLAELDTQDDEDFAGADEITPLPEPAFEEEPEPSQESPPPVTLEEPTTGQLTEEEAADASPDWLQDLHQVESQAKGGQSDLVQEDLPDWLSNMKPSADTQGSSISGLGLDVDLSDDFAELPPELSGADLPDWLQGISTSPRQREGDLTSAEHGSDIPDWLRPGEGEQVQQQDSSGQLRSILSELPPPRDPREGLAKADIPEWVDALKPKELTGGRQQAAPSSPAPESGPLLGVQGVIEIAPVMAASHAAHKVPVSELTITPEQQQQAELLQQLAQGELLLSETVVSPRRRLAWGRLLLSLILLAVMSAAIILDTRLSLVREDTVPAPAPIEMAQTAVTAAAGQAVLVAFDYTPALEGELATEADALMAQLAANGSPVIAVSQSAAGTAVAATYTDDPTLFIPGEAIGLRQMGDCLADGCELLFGRSLEHDLSQVGLIIVLTGERKSLVNWIEQVASQTNAPMLAATTQSLEPVAMSYVSSGQLAGIWSYLAALGRYEDTLPAATATTAGQRTVNAQVLVQLLLVALLLLGLVRKLGRTDASRNR